jgi:hypothetical protein
MFEKYYDVDIPIVGKTVPLLYGEIKIADIIIN